MPVWLDQGRSLLNVIEKMQEADLPEDTWIVMTAMICAQIEYDLMLHKAGEDLLSQIGDESPGEPL